jgi:hypothetical protein
MPSDRERLLARKQQLEAERERLMQRLEDEESPARKRTLRAKIGRLDRKIDDINQLLGLAAATAAIEAFLATASKRESGSRGKVKSAKRRRRKQTP